MCVGLHTEVCCGWFVEVGLSVRICKLTFCGTAILVFLVEERHLELIFIGRDSLALNMLLAIGDGRVFF